MLAIIRLVASCTPHAGDNIRSVDWGHVAQLPEPAQSAAGEILGTYEASRSGDDFEARLTALGYSTWLDATNNMPLWKHYSRGPIEAKPTRRAGFTFVLTAMPYQELIIYYERQTMALTGYKLGPTLYDY